MFQHNTTSDGQGDCFGRKRGEVVGTYQRVAGADGRGVADAEVGERGGERAGGADGGLRADERLHALQRGRRLLPHQVAPHQRLQLDKRLQRPQRLLRLRQFRTTN
jgi:hypothetical protein